MSPAGLGFIVFAASIEPLERGAAQETFFRLIEDAFLPDIRAATILDMVN